MPEYKGLQLPGATCLGKLAWQSFGLDCRMLSTWGFRLRRCVSGAVLCA